MESLNGKLRDEFLDREVLDTLLEAQVLTEQSADLRRFRPHSSWATGHQRRKHSCPRTLSQC